LLELNDKKIDKQQRKGYKNKQENYRKQYEHRISLARVGKFTNNKESRVEEKGCKQYKFQAPKI
jgi:hypothetical protein